MFSFILSLAKTLFGLFLGAKTAQGEAQGKAEQRATDLATDVAILNAEAQSETAKPTLDDVRKRLENGTA